LSQGFEVGVQTLARKNISQAHKNFLTMERGSPSTIAQELKTDATDFASDLSSHPLQSASASSTGISSAREFSNIRPARYYHSRRIRKDENYEPPKFKKHRGEKWLWIIPTIGLIGGLAVGGLIVYNGIGGQSHNYCPVLDEDFSSGVLNPRIWTKEVEVGGFG
jgi:hypothetical protein